MKNPVMRAWHWFKDSACAEERRQIKQFEEERKRQDKRLDELTVATINGEAGWFRDAVKNDPSCALRVMDECRKEGGA